VERPGGWCTHGWQPLLQARRPPGAPAALPRPCGDRGPALRGGACRRGGASGTWTPSLGALAPVPTCRRLRSRPWPPPPCRAQPHPLPHPPPRTLAGWCGSQRGWRLHGSRRRRQTPPAQSTGATPPRRGARPPPARARARAQRRRRCCAAPLLVRGGWREAALWGRAPGLACRCGGRRGAVCCGQRGAAGPAAPTRHSGT
jgi:hypothetical protein